MARYFPIDIYVDCLDLIRIVSSWWSKLPEGSTIVQPKIDGFAIGLRYKYGQLVDAYSREDSEIIENIRNINAIPLSIDDSLKVEVELEGILYSPSSNSKNSIEQLLSNSISKIDKNTSLLFLAFQIFVQMVMSYQI